MTIRNAEPADVPAIIKLMRSSLGESTIPKSESLWNWKHQQNPFGASYVLVAEESGELIGLRAFMQWKWLWRGQPYRAIRAVDTATHPSHQGKGIFKKLTLKQLELCKEDGVNFVFNTPNNQSRPGYLKMGWEQQGKMPLKLKLLKPMKMALAKFGKNAPSTEYNDPTPSVSWSAGIEVMRHFKKPANDDKLITDLSSSYINWRYAENPLFNYTYFTNEADFLLIGRIKHQGGIVELRLTEFINFSEPTPQAVNNLRKRVNLFCKQHDVHFISLSGATYQQHNRWFGWMGLIPVRRLGPIVTLRDLNMHSHFDQLMDAGNWNYSLGDMELF